jgi:hypothetical protein
MYECWNVAVLKKAFDAFDREKSGSISTNMVEEILRLMGQPFNRNTLEELIDEVDADSKYTQNVPLLGPAMMLSRGGEEDRTMFDTSPDHVGFIVDKVAIAQIFLRVQYNLCNPAMR